MNQKGFIPITVIIIVMAASIVASGSLFYHIAKTRKVKEVSITPPPAAPKLSAKTPSVGQLAPSAPVAKKPAPVLSPTPIPVPEQTDSTQPPTQQCQGTKTKFDFAPVNVGKTKIMIPRGLMVGDHTTPVMHHYFQNFDNQEYDIEVYSSGKGTITEIGHMPNAEEGKDYLMVIRHTCTISSHYIYVSNLPEKLRKPLEGHPEGAYVQIPVEAGELIGYYKYNLDYNLIDEEITLTGFAVPKRYTSEQPVTIHVVPDTFAYFNELVKNKLIGINVRTAEPISGKFDYDIDGKLVGNWFIEEIGAYGRERGHLGMLSVVYDYIDPTRIVISIGGYGGQDSRGFGVKTNAPDPKDIGVESGLVKYELVDYEYLKSDGNYWDRISLAKNLRTVSSEIVQGVVLVQMIAQRKIKFEAFSGKTAAEVNGFTSAARIYER